MAGILDLPLEILEMILHQKDVSARDALSLTHTCTSLRNLLSLSNRLWMKKIINEWPELSFLANEKLVWFDEYIYMLETHDFCQNRIIKLSATYYWSKLSLSNIHLDEFKTKSKQYDGMAFHYIIALLKRICKHKVFYYDSYPHPGLNTITNKYYARIILDCLWQERLKMNWNALAVNTVPERVSLFFLQWIEPLTEYSPKHFQKGLIPVVKYIEGLLPKDHPLHAVDPSKRAKWCDELLQDNEFDGPTCRGLIQFIYQKLPLDLSRNRNDQTMPDFILNHILEIMRSSKIPSVIFYEAVLRRCGIRCDVIFSPNHIFFLWRENWAEESIAYMIDTATGIMKFPSLCPYSAKYVDFSNKELYTYTPLKTLVSLTTCMIRNTHIKKLVYRNLFELLHFLQPNSVQHMCVLAGLYIDERKDTEYIKQKLYNIYEREDKYTVNHNVRVTLSKINQINYDRAESPIREKIINERTTNVKFAIGMICTHKTYGYECVIRGWDRVCAASPEKKLNMGLENLRHKDQQPFYHVYAIDLSSRYVAEENLLILNAPERLIDLEEILGYEFSHFNGFFYIPNFEKDEEYPHDWQVRAAHQMHMRSRFT